MKSLRFLLPVVASLAAFSLAGCRPFEQPVFEEVGNNETAYVIPLTGDTSQQGKFQSAQFLEQRKVAAKRIQIPLLWVETGRMPADGFYQAQVRVIKVDRSPVTAEFHQDMTAIKTKDADAIWIESKDSVGFSTGFSVTGLIKEEDTSTFLYRYNALSLRQVISTEVRARIQQDAAQFAAQYILDDLRAKKNEMLDEIRKDVVPFFGERGITITTIGQFGGMTYENADIQKAIDNTFVAQQEKVVAAAKLSAQGDINAKSESAAKQDKANAILLAEGQAQAIRLVSEAAKEAASNPAFLRLRELEVQAKQIERWNGITPSTLIEGGGSTGLSMFIAPKS